MRTPALGGLAVGAVLALVAGSRPWWRAAGDGVSVAFTGTESSGGLAQALALVVLAGALLALVLKSRGRRVLGVLLLLTGAGAVVLGLDRSRPATQAVRSRVLEVSLADQFALVGTAWPYVFAAAGLVVVLAAGTMALTAPRWPSRTARYERPAVTPGAPASPAAAVADARREDDPAALWRLLDAGVDPTAADGRPVAEPGNRAVEDPAEQSDEHPGDERSSRRAVVQEQPSGVTMNRRVDTRTDEPT
nr:Trp biosynthesis-associated membrane protein [Microlunatus antarcticus]